ncbi:hypothetical protein NBRC10512_002531 [Rhodotorula toruloides]|uniref:RHTO0S01e07580g1_1 n=2 Tax=Rhodotorula toruloides TaxID=5286 RepID=A0A061AM63_RHOTO|nr:uncharacterized protein RHTO_01351 [Rhodotorula toruloides NP11]EMS21704.1 hypothetical protein RHTO_01351 [Rhodotorula toruloides NP11]KAJ8292330.1 hypothetical protein OF846_004628 [Rhodotorula toruloides]CDR35809.1 RHTO0S01e07580g1_1 [Rhodotorula toruloides]
MSAVYTIFTSPNHPLVPGHLPTLIVTPHGRPMQTLYTYLHTNSNTENFLLTPSEGGDLCVAKLFPPDQSGSLRSARASGGSGVQVRCEASRGLSWRIQQTGIQNPIYKLTLPNPENPEEEQPLFQISKPNPSAPFWSLFYFAYAGHLIPPKRVEFGRISKNVPEQGGGTRVSITGKTDEEKAVWKTIGEGNEDGVEWIVICAAMCVLDDEIVEAAEKAGIPPASGPAGGAKSRGNGSAPPMLAAPVPTSASTSGGLRPPSPHKARVLPPLHLSTDLPRSASSNSLGQLHGPFAPSPQLPQAQMGYPAPPRNGPSPSGSRQTPPTQQQQPPPRSRPSSRGQSVPPPPDSSQNGYPPPPELPQHYQQQQQQRATPPQPQQQAPPPRGSSRGVPMPQPQPPSQPMPHPHEQYRQPSSHPQQPYTHPPQPQQTYQHPNGSQQQYYQPPPQQQQPPPDQRRYYQLSDAPVPPRPVSGGGGTAAARMVQQQVEQRRLQKARGG